MVKVVDVIPLDIEKDAALVAKYVAETGEDNNKVYIIPSSGQGNGSYKVSRGKITTIDQEFSTVSNVIILEKDTERITYSLSKNGILRVLDEPLIAGIFCNDDVIEVNGRIVSVRPEGIKKSVTGTRALQYLAENGIGVLGHNVPQEVTEQDTESIKKTYGIDFVK